MKEFISKEHPGFTPTIVAHSIVKKFIFTHTIDPFQDFITSPLTFASYGKLLTTAHLHESSMFASRDDQAFRKSIGNFNFIPDSYFDKTSFFEKQTNPISTKISIITKERDYSSVPVAYITHLTANVIAHSPNRDSLIQNILDGQFIPLILHEMCNKARTANTNTIVLQLHGIRDFTCPTEYTNTILDLNWIQTESGFKKLLTFYNQIFSHPYNYIAGYTVSKSKPRLPLLYAGRQITHSSISTKIGPNQDQFLFALFPQNSYPDKLSDTAIFDAVVINAHLCCDKNNFVDSNAASLYEIQSMTNESKMQYILLRTCGKITNTAHMPPGIAEDFGQEEQAGILPAGKRIKENKIPKKNNVSNFSDAILLGTQLYVRASKKVLNVLKRTGIFNVPLNNIPTFEIS